ncbi:MAG: hypothetical protein JSV49_10500 [Thermoplasmata archaeon]|nr:MAG: hypothetical protein JSV49_10500 [Thermoplasmata archaeon]
MNTHLFGKSVVGLLILTLILSGITAAAFKSGPDENKVQNPFLQSVDYDIFVDTIEVQDYEIVPGVLKNKQYPGREVNITTRIWNLGDKSVTTPFEILMIIIDDVNEVDVHYEIHLRSTITSLKSSTFVDLNWKWIPPANPPEGATWDYEADDGHEFKVRVVSLYDGDENSTNNFNSINVKIEAPRFAPALTNEVWDDYEKTVTPLIQVIPCKSVFWLNFTVNETVSTEIDYISVDVSVPEGWVVLPGSIKPFYEVTKKRGVSVNLRIQVSRDSYLSIQMQDYPIKILAYSLYSPPKNDTIQFTVNLKYCPGPVFLLPQDITLLPGTHLVDVSLLNAGNGADIFIISSSVFDLTKKGWEVSVHSGIMTKMLKVTETTKVTLMVKVPAASKDSSANIIVTAQSKQLPSYDTGDRYHFKIYVGKYHSVDLRLPEEVSLPVIMEPSQQYSFELELENTGNFQDPTITAQVFDNPQGWQVILDTSNIPGSGLGMGKMVHLGLLVKIPAGTAVGTHTISISGLAGEPQFEYDRLVIPVEVIGVGSLLLESKPASQTANIGEVLHYRIYVKNTGNHLDTYDLEVMPVNSELFFAEQLSQEILSLEANTSFEVILTVTIPLDAPSDSNPNTPSELDGYEFIVTARSQNYSSVFRTVKAEAYVNPFYDFNIYADNTARSVIQGSSDPVQFKINIANLGNVKDTYELEVESEYDWGRLLARYKPVSAGTVSAVSFEANPPPDTPVGDYEFKINARSLGDVERFDEITLNLYVGILEFRITTLTVNGQEQIKGESVKVKGGSTAMISVKVENSGTLLFENTTFRDCSVVFFDGKTTIGREYISYLPVQESVTILIPWETPEIASVITIYVNLDPEEDIQFSNREYMSDSITVEITNGGEQADSEKGLIGLIAYLIPIFIIFILIIVQLVSFKMIVRVKSARVKEGYTASGEYKPFADIFEPFGKKGEISFEVPKRRFLPPETYTIRTTRPIHKTKPLVAMKPVRKLSGD